MHPKLFIFAGFGWFSKEVGGDGSQVRAVPSAMRAVEFTSFISSFLAVFFLFSVISSFFVFSPTFPTHPLLYLFSAAIHPLPPPFFAFFRLYVVRFPPCRPRFFSFTPVRLSSLRFPLLPFASLPHPYVALKPFSHFRHGRLPPGVFQIVNGGREAVESLCDHPSVAALSFVGSSNVARLVAERCRAVNKRVLALGGAENHLVALPDCE